MGSEQKTLCAQAIIVSLFMLCAATSAVAQPAPEPEVQVTEKEMKSFEATKGSLAEAIKIAAKKADAGIVDVRCDGRSGQLTYTVRTFEKNNLWEEAVDALAKSFDRPFRRDGFGKRKRL